MEALEGVLGVGRARLGLPHRGGVERIELLDLRLGGELGLALCTATSTALRRLSGASVTIVQTMRPTPVTSAAHHQSVTSSSRLPTEATAVQA